MGGSSLIDFISGAIVALLHHWKYVYLYLGLCGLLVDLVVQVGFLPPLISEIFGIFLLVIVIYEINLPNLALNIEKTAKWRWLISISGILPYIYLRYFLSNFVLLVVVLIALFLIITWMLWKDVNWSSLPRGLKKRYDQAYHAAEKNDPNFAGKDALLFWGLYRTSQINIFRFMLTALLLFPYYMGIMGSSLILSVFDEIVPTSLITSLALLLLAFIKIKQKIIKQLQYSILKQHLNKKLSSILDPLKKLWDKKEEIEQTHILSIITSFIKHRAMLYTQILLWVSVYCFAFIFVSGYFLKKILMDYQRFFFNYPQYSIILIGLLIAFLLSFIIPLFFSIQLFSSLTKKDMGKIWLIRCPHFFLACSALMIWVILIHQQFTLLLPSMPSLERFSVLNYDVPVLILVLVIGLIQVCYLLWILIKKEFTNLYDYGENKLTVFLIVYTITILLIGSEVINNLTIFVLASWFWYSTISVFKSLLHFSRASKRSILSLIACYLVTGAYYYYNNQLFSLIAFAGAFSMIPIIAFLLLKSQMHRLGWILLGARGIEKSEQYHVNLSVRHVLFFSFLLASFLTAGSITTTISEKEFSLSNFWRFGIEWLGVSFAFMSILFGLTAFHSLFGIRKTILSILVGIFVLSIDALLISRPIQFSLLGKIAHATIFIILAIVIISYYRAEGYRNSIVASLSVAILGILTAISNAPYDPVFQLIFAARLIINNVPTGLFMEIISASIANLAISVLWGFLVGDIFFGNADMGKYYSERSPLLKTSFFVTQLLTITYLMFLLFGIHDITSRIIEGDQFYYILDIITLFFMVYYLITKVRKAVTFNNWDVSRSIFVIVGTIFLIPTLYPIIDGMLRFTSLIGFISTLKRG